MSEPPATGEWPPPTHVESAEWPTIPGYEILGELGRGGMGVVYRARQTSLRRLVALKLIRDAALAGAPERGRFRIEAEAAARMRYPHIVQIYEVGEHQGRPYFAMELVEGGGLDRYLAGRPQPVRWAAELGRTLALAVQHAHEQSVIHRDLKPANVLLQRKDEADKSLFGSSFVLPPSFVPKVTDFGLAKRLDSQSTGWTRDGAVLGTPSYMAPEQAAGRVREVGPAADVYALGAILYECLTGRPPFRGDSWGDTVQRVLHDEPAPPRRLRPDVPANLEAVCLKCLEKDPGRRYAGARELADDLGAFLDGRAVAAVPLTERERLGRLARRDGYELGGEIGRGPRSTVYQALYDPLRQLVAVKVFRTGLCTREDWEARQQRGAGLRAAVVHPHVVGVQQTGWWDGAPYVAVEYVPHGSLAARLTGRPHALRAALRLVEQLTEVVRFLHRQGVVHGNLKPTNVLMAADGIPRVVDFHATGGLFQGAEDGGDPAGIAYLAPELARDPAAQPRPNTDVYGLGVILYELLTGRPPFAGATAREVREQVGTQDPAPPSRFNAEVTPLVERFCLRCLRKNPWRRYYRVHDVLIRLQYFQEDPEGRTRRRPGPPETGRDALGGTP